MIKIYDANGKTKKTIIEMDNDYRAHYKQRGNEINETELIMVGNIDMIPFDGQVDCIWNMNGLSRDDKNLKRIIIVEPFIEHINSENLIKIGEIGTRFKGPIHLSERATILIPLEIFANLKENNNFNILLEKYDIRAYEGDPILATEMLFSDKNYTELEVGEEGFKYTNDRLDSHNYARELSEVIYRLQEKMQEGVKIYPERPKRKIKGPRKNLTQLEGASHFRLISGLTPEVEGTTLLNSDMQGATNIGKRRDNQEDAFLLIRDKANSKFKMAVVADGMGGYEGGEIASDYIVKSLKGWFESFTYEQRAKYFEDVTCLKEELKNKIGFDLQIGIENAVLGIGGSTIVCAIVGKDNTIIANIGDSRAYIVKGSQVEQVSREDTVAYEHYLEGKTTTKEEARFDKEANLLLQGLGMARRDLKNPYIVIIPNDYDRLLLFSDGVTDCLSDEDIGIICKTTDRKLLAKTIVEEAIRHDSVLPEEKTENDYLNMYIPGGKDNTTAIVVENERE